MGTLVWHCDADAFFAACHVARDVSLRGKPLVVGGDPNTRHGIVLTASYEARRFGVRTAMPLHQAMRLCPALLVVPPERGLYEAVNRGLRAVWDEFSPVVEPCSIDEAWLAMGPGTLFRWGGDPVAAARALQCRVARTLGITVSIGMAHNKMLAKQASDMEKPNGVTYLTRDAIGARLWPLEARALYGIGPRAAEQLAERGIRTIGDVAAADGGALETVLGRRAPVLRARALGEDDTPVAVPVPGDEQSLSVERTLARDVTHLEDARPVLLGLADALATRLQRHQRWGHTVMLKYKSAQFASHSRQLQLPTPTQDRDRLYRAAVALFRTKRGDEPVRLLGLGVSRLVGAPADLFEAARQEKLNDAVDSIRQRFGREAIGPAASRGRVGDAPSTFQRDSDPPSDR